MGVAIDDLDAVEQRMGALDIGGMVDFLDETAGPVAVGQPIELGVVLARLVE